MAFSQSGHAQVSGAVHGQIPIHDEVNDMLVVRGQSAAPQMQALEAGTGRDAAAMASRAGSRRVTANQPANTAASLPGAGAVGAVMMGSVPTGAFQEIPLRLSVGQAHVLAENHVKRVAVGNGKVLQVTSLDANQLLLMPDAPGQSTLHVWLANGVQRRYRVVVTERDPSQVMDEVRSMLGDSTRTTTRVVGDKVVVESPTPTEDDAYRIGEIQKRFPQVVNFASRSGYERMVNMEVRMIEIARNSLERLGVQWQSRNGTPWTFDGPTFGVVGDFSRGHAFRPDGGAAGAEGFGVRPYVGPFSTASSLVSSISSMVDLMVSTGEAAILAEPRLSSRSGGTARFVAGGELPIPVIGANGSASVQFKEYGVRFEVAPVVNSLGVISATLHAEISSINPEVRVKDIPGLRKQSASTQVNLREGETLVIAGMVSNEMSGTIDRLPGVGNLPVLGPLFRSRRFQDRETEMIVLITPYLDANGSPDRQARTQLVQQKYDAMRDRLKMLD